MTNNTVNQDRNNYQDRVPMRATWPPAWLKQLNEPQEVVPEQGGRAAKKSREAPASPGPADPEPLMASATCPECGGKNLFPYEGLVDVVVLRCMDCRELIEPISCKGVPADENMRRLFEEQKALRAAIRNGDGAPESEESLVDGSTELEEP